MVAWSEETPTVLRSEESVETKLLRIAEKARNEYVQTSANYRMRSRVRESRKHGSGRGAGANGCVWTKYCGTAGKPGGKRRKQTSFCNI